MLLNTIGYVLQFAWVTSVLYGTYCAVQAWNRRLPRRHRHHSAVPTLDDFTPDGRRYLKKALRAGAVAIGAVLVAVVVF